MVTPSSLSFFNFDFNHDCELGSKLENGSSNISISGSDKNEANIPSLFLFPAESSRLYFFEEISSVKKLLFSFRKFVTSARFLPCKLPINSKNSKGVKNGIKKPSFKYEPV